MAPVHIVSVADEKYKAYLMATVSSAMRAAEGFHIVFHLLGDGFLQTTVDDFTHFIEQNGHEVRWLMDAEVDVEIPLTMYFSRAASLRLFLADMIDPKVDRVIYLDSDTILCEGAVRRLHEVDIGDKAFGAVIDADADYDYLAKRLGWRKPYVPYVNSGVLIINLRKWREVGATQRHAAMLRERPESLLYVDQDVLNLCWPGDIHHLPLDFNVMSAVFAFSPAFLAKGNHGPFYTEAEIRQAKAKPAVLHFYGYLINRPWRAACYHPLKQRYVDAANASPYPYRLEETGFREKARYARMHVLGEVEAVVKRGFYRTASRVKRAVLGR